MKLRFHEMFLIALMAVGMISFFDFASAWAVSLKVWSSGETIRSTDLNANFAALNAYTGTITDARIDGNAQISHTKLKTPSLVAKAWVFVSSSCTSDPCTKTESYGFDNINRSAAGKYTLNISYGPKDVDFATVVTAKGSASAKVFCMVTGQDSTYALIECQNDAGTFTDVAFSAIIYDLEDP